MVRDMSSASINYQSSHQAFDHDAILLTVCATYSNAFLSPSFSVDLLGEKAGIMMPQSGSLKRNAKTPPEVRKLRRAPISQDLGGNLSDCPRT